MCLIPKQTNKVQFLVGIFVGGFRLTLFIRVAEVNMTTNNDNMRVKIWDALMIIS